MDDCEDCGRALCRDCGTHYCCEPCRCGRLHTCDCACDEYLAGLAVDVGEREAAKASGCWCDHAEDRHWSSATNMTFPDGCHDCPGWNGAHAYGQELPWLPEG